MRTTISEFLKDLREEIIIAVMFSIVFIVIFICKYFDLWEVPIDIFLKSYLTPDRLNGAASFFAITIGVYIAVITILATSEISISRELLVRKLDRRIIKVAMVGMSENLMCAGCAIFIPINKISSRMILTLVVLSVISFIKFIVLLLRIFIENMNQMAKAIDEKERYDNDILTYVEEISKYCRKHMNDEGQDTP